MPPFESIRINSMPRWHHCEAAWHWAPQPLPDYDVWFVAGGRGELRLEEGSFELRAGVCFVVRPGARPLGTHDPRHRLVVFSCHFEPLGNAGELAWPDPMQVRDTAFFMASASRAEKLWRRGDELARLQSRLCVENMLRQLWDEARETPPSPLDTAFEALAEHIRREPGEKWALDGMADTVHLSRAQFVRRFRLQFGQSPARFVIETRLERARQLLRETNLTLDQIAHALGYTNAQFFARQFRQFCGQTPGQWRRAAH
jgi:AraC-like DNA-binding protein